ncbi:MAG: 30S ribosomal protein S24e [Candidatus Bathyarchaeota archaeon]|nr:30S ribosomal protein S24e [Candidatus Bathyarchaeota archaeon]
MKLELTSTKINKVVGRKELAFKVDEASTPSRADVRRDIAVLMRTELDNVYVRKLKTKAGTRKITGVAHVYNDAATALAIEPKYIITRNKGKEAVKAEETPAAAAAPEEEKK